MNILLAVDGSEVSQRAVERVIAFTGELRDAPHVHLLYVHPPVPMSFATRHVSRTVLDDYYREEGERELEPGRRRLEAAGIPFTPHIHVGQPGETVAHVARQLDCALIAMGTHGRGALAGAVLGSVASKVLQLAAVPVLLAR